jgi:hypothetical protein
VFSHGKATVDPTAAFSREGSFAMREPQPRSFAAQVHQVIDLDDRRAAVGATGADLASGTARSETQAALSVLATSLRGTHRPGWRGAT